jgi:hypothetical protein
MIVRTTVALKKLVPGGEIFKTRGTTKLSPQKPRTTEGRAAQVFKRTLPPNFFFPFEKINAPEKRIARGVEMRREKKANPKLVRIKGMKPNLFSEGNQLEVKRL